MSRSPTPVRVGEHAVVIGASMAGLCAARVLADRFETVSVIDRDRLPNSSGWRSQVPQGRHPHLLLAAGVRILEAWFPGITEQLYRGGAVEVDLTADVYWHQSGGVARRPRSTMRGPSMSRPFLEWTVRRQVECLPNVTLHPDNKARGFDLGRAGERVAAVHTDAGSIPCDLVVDATGRQARSLPWLEAEGYPRPEVSRVEIDTRYVTQEFRRVDQPDRDWKVAVVIDDPAAKRVAMALPIEGDRWLVVFGGVHGETAPLDLGHRLAYARTLPSTVLADVLDVSEAVADPVTHRFRSSQRRHVERLQRFAIGWVLLGDAIASFNPIYGQGMTAAAQQAAALGDALDRRGIVDRKFARRYFKAAGRTVNAAWSTAVGGDFAYEGTTGPKPRHTDLLNQYIDRVIAAGQCDDLVALRFSEVVAMVRKPAALMSPAFMLRALRRSRQARTG